MRAMSKRAALADVARGLGRDDAGRRHRLGGGGLDEQPGLVAALVAPDPPHLGVCVIAIDESFASSRSSRSARNLQARSRCPSTVAASDPFRNRSAATRCTSAAVTRSMPCERFVEAELPIEVDLLPRQVRHAARGVLEAQHEAALQVILRALQLGVGHRRAA